MRNVALSTQRSDSLFEQALQLIPGGVNSPVRAFRSVGRNPLFISRASGSKIWDVDGNEYVDYVGSWGPMILGHAHPNVVDAIVKAAEKGTSYGAPTELEVRMAELICSAMPSIEMVRMVNSGTEATMSSIRLARAFTGREKIVKFEGCYHGHGDSFLIKAGSGAMTFGTPDSPGVTAGVAQNTLTALFNDAGSVARLFDANQGQIACVIVEPVVGNMGCVPPQGEFLQRLRDICMKEGAILIFDEVMTGFRVARGGAQSLYGVTPDLTTLGKIIGGGLPVGAYGGRREIMELVSPSGPMYQAGTLSGNPLAMAAGFVTLQIILDDPRFFESLEVRCRQLEEGFRSNIHSLGLSLTLNRVGSMLTLFFNAGPVTDYQSALRSDTAMYAKYFRSMLSQGIYLPPSQFEVAFVSAAHTTGDVERTIATNRRALEGMEVHSQETR